MNNSLLPPTHHFDDDISIDLSDLNLNSNPTITIDTSSWNTMASGVTYAPVSNSVLTVGTGASPIWTTNTSASPAMHVTTHEGSGRVELQGNKADIIVNGESLMDTLRGIQDRLNVLQPNPELEAEWDQLRELGEQYRKLEKEFTEKAKMWQTLKKI